MRGHRLKQTILTITGLTMGLLVITALSLNAQPLGSGAESPAERATTKVEAFPFYDITREVTLSGPVTGIMQGPTAGLIPGAHLLLVTGAGTVDASLGKWGLYGKTAPTIANGEQVTVRGVMKTIRNREVFIVRTMMVGGHTYTIRNQHGVPVSPQARERAENSAEKGVSL